MNEMRALFIEFRIGNFGGLELGLEFGLESNSKSSGN